MPNIEKLPSGGKLPGTVDQILAARQPAMDSDLLQVLSVLMESFPARENEEISLEVRIKGFQLALADWPIEPIQAALVDFLKGDVERAGQAFAPSPAEFAKQVKLRFWQMQKTQRDQAAANAGERDEQAPVVDLATRGQIGEKMRKAFAVPHLPRAKPYVSPSKPIKPRPMRPSGNLGALFAALDARTKHRGNGDDHG